MQIRPKCTTIDVLNSMKQMMMIVPVNAEEDEAQCVGQKCRQQRNKRRHIGAVRYLQIQHHDGNDYGDHAIAKCFQSTLAQGTLLRIEISRAVASSPCLMRRRVSRSLAGSARGSACGAVP